MDKKTHRTGLEGYYAVDEKNRKLRYGYTTGSCAAAAAQAATRMLLTGEKVEEVALQTPKGILLHLLIEEISMDEGRVRCAVQKDGGDDPDVTTGIYVYANVSRRDAPQITLDGGIGVGRVTRPGLWQAVGEAAINKVPRQMILENVEQVCKEYHYTGGLDVQIEIPAGDSTGGQFAAGDEDAGGRRRVLSGDYTGKLRSGFFKRTDKTGSYLFDEM